MDEVMSAVCSFQKFNRAVPRPATKIDAAKDDCFIRVVGDTLNGLFHERSMARKRQQWN